MARGRSSVRRRTPSDPRVSRMTETWSVLCGLRRLYISALTLRGMLWYARLGIVKARRANRRRPVQRICKMPAQRVPRLGPHLMRTLTWRLRSTRSVARLMAIERSRPAAPTVGLGPPATVVGGVMAGSGTRISADCEVFTPALFAVTVTRTCPGLFAVSTPAGVTLAPAVLVSIGAIW